MTVWKWSGESRYPGAFPPVLEKFCRAFSPGPTDCPWVSEDEKEFEQIGYKIQKICGGKMYSRTRTFGAEVHKSNIRVTRWHNKYMILNYFERRDCCLSDLLTKSNRTTLQSYKVEERTFGTPCIVCGCPVVMSLSVLLGSDKKQFVRCR